MLEWSYILASTLFMIHHLKQKQVDLKMKQGFIKVQEDNSKNLNPKLAVIYISINGGIYTVGFVENLFIKQLDLEILSPTSNNGATNPPPSSSV